MTNGLMAVGAAVAAGAAIGAAVYKRRHVVAEEPHVLAGSIARRMNAFNNLAGKAGEGASRPERAADADAYHLDGGIAGV